MIENPFDPTTKKKRVGRPTVMTEVVLRRLEEAFLKGLRDSQACLHAGILQTTLCSYERRHPRFAEWKEMLKSNVNMKARLNIYDAVEKGDLGISKWFLERRDLEFTPRQSAELTAAVSFTDLFHRAAAECAPGAEKTLDAPDPENAHDDDA